MAEVPPAPHLQGAEVAEARGQEWWVAPGLRWAVVLVVMEEGGPLRHLLYLVWPGSGKSRHFLHRWSLFSTDLCRQTSFPLSALQSCGLFNSVCVCVCPERWSFGVFVHIHTCAHNLVWSWDCFEDRCPCGCQSGKSRVCRCGLGFGRSVLCTLFLF